MGRVLGAGPNASDVMFHECEFETLRLSASGWRSPRNTDRDLIRVVTELLTPAVTASLPEPWQGPYSPERARNWIAERDAEGTTLLVTDRYSGQAVGLMILFETVPDDGSDGVAVRLGYLLAESAWGRGLASELVKGLVTWCRNCAGVRSIVAGVEPDNAASARVLTKNGFVLADTAQDGGQQTYELLLST